MVIDTLRMGSNFIALDKGRQPQFAGNIVEFGIDETLNGIAPATESETLSVDVTPQHKSFAISIACYNFNNTDSPRGTLRVLINNNVVAQWALPADWSPLSNWQVTDVIPVIKEFWGGGNTMSVNIVFDAALTSNVGVGMKLKLLCIPI